LVGSATAGTDVLDAAAVVEVVVEAAVVVVVLAAVVDVVVPGPAVDAVVVVPDEELGLLPHADKRTAGTAKSRAGAIKSRRTGDTIEHLPDLRVHRGNRNTTPTQVPQSEPSAMQRTLRSRWIR
jgi:hypothetical protein